MKTVLTIAGFDPSSGAGITADLMVFAAHGLFGTSCITALTVQNTVGVFATQAVATHTIADTLIRLYEDLPPAGIKIGMLATSEIVSTVATFLSRIRPENTIPILFDPVLKSSSGKDLADANTVDSIRSELLPLLDWITPNTDELAALLHLKATPQDLPAAAFELEKLGKNLTVVVTGGHLEPPNDLLLEPGQVPQFVQGTRIQTTSTHGTGCALSSALLSRLVLGDEPLAALTSAKEYVAEAMRSATPRGTGHGPLNHLWPLLSHPNRKRGPR